jgi:hypothetical protein
LFFVKLKATPEQTMKAIKDGIGKAVEKKVKNTLYKS